MTFDLVTGKKGIRNGIFSPQNWAMWTEGSASLAAVNPNTAAHWEINANNK